MGQRCFNRSVGLRGWSIGASALAVAGFAWADVFSARFTSEDFPPEKQVAGWNHRIVRFRWNNVAKSGLLFGAAPNVGASDVGYGQYTIHEKTATDPSGAPDERPDWEVYSGYAVIRGWFPIIRTRIVRAVSPSTTLALEINPDGTEWIYVIQGAGATIEILQGKDTGKIYTLAEGQFLKVQGRGSELGQVRTEDLEPDSTPKKIANDFHAQDFYERVIAQPQYRTLEEELY